MSAKFTSKIRSFIANSLINDIVSQLLPKWETGVNYTEGTLVQYGNNKYINKSNGISGTIPPTHVNGTASDGQLYWIWVESDTVKMFKRNMYVFIGKNTPWLDENNPDSAGITNEDDYSTIRNIMTLKKITNNNFRLGIKRYNWNVAGVYDQYDNKKDPLEISGSLAYNNPHYVFTDDNNIYLCLNNNNNSPSTIKPTSTGVIPFVTADNYMWKYMCSLDADSSYFLSNDFIPVKYKLQNDGSFQWNVQNAAIKGSISTFEILKDVGVFPDDTISTIYGGNPATIAQAYITKKVDNTINQILVQPDHIGLNYDISDFVYVIVKDSTKGGTGAEISDITVVDGIITNITFTSGSGYTSGAICILIDLENTPITNAVLTVSTAIDNSISDVIIENGGSGYSNNLIAFIIPGDSGAVGKAIFAPKEGHGHNVLTELCANTAIINIRLSEASNYFLTGEPFAFRQIGLITDIVDKTTLNIANEQHYIGYSHPNYGDDALNEMDSVIGYILYLNNLKTVIRSEGQDEDLKISITL